MCWKYSQGVRLIEYAFKIAAWDFLHCTRSCGVAQRIVLSTTLQLKSIEGCGPLNHSGTAILSFLTLLDIVNSRITQIVQGVSPPLCHIS
mmetsp:Transcript_7698/g.24214  ORF Transcript_7698/g.24214 Transcript_7698/m.24214 type:complete len:90 (-) Transcript_7698:1551-1820(-)